MAVALSASGSTVAYTSGQPSVTVPAGASVGDYCLIAVSTQTGITVTTPSGWNLLQGSEPFLRVYSKFLTSGEPGSAVPFTISSAFFPLTASVVCYSGADTTTPINATGVYTSGFFTTGVTPAAATTSAAGCQAVAFGGLADGSNASFTTSGSGWTELLDSANGQASSTAATKTIASAGTTGTVTFTALTAGNIRGQIYTINPAASGVTGTAAVTLGATVASGSGTHPRTGTAAVSLGSTAAAGTGTHPRTATAAVNLGSTVAAGTGTHPRTGSAAVSLGATVAAGTGTHPRTATAAVTLGSTVAAGTGTHPRTATAAVTLGSTVAAGSASFAASVTASGAVTLGSTVAAGTGTHPRTATADVTLGATVAAGTGTHERTGTAAVLLGAVVALGTAVTDVVEAVVLGAGSYVGLGTTVLGQVMFGDPPAQTVTVIRVTTGYTSIGVGDAYSSLSVEPLQITLMEVGRVHTVPAMDRIPVTSTEPIYADVVTREDPTATTVDLAFLNIDDYTSADQPDDLDWETGAWAGTAAQLPSGQFKTTATITVGPAGTVVPAGTHHCWIRVGTVVRRFDKLTIY